MRTWLLIGAAGGLGALPGVVAQADALDPLAQLALQAGSFGLLCWIVMRTIPSLLAAQDARLEAMNKTRVEEVAILRVEFAKQLDAQRAAEAAESREWLEELRSLAAHVGKCAIAEALFRASPSVDPDDNEKDG